jgi:hypothetical protein
MATRRIARAGRAVGVGVTSALVGGVGAAALTRPLMRAAALLTSDQPGFTISGTVSILLVYVACLVPGAVALVLGRSWWAWTLYGAGCVVLLGSAYGIASTTVEDAVLMTGQRWALLVLTLTTMALVYAAQFVGVARGALRGRAWTTTVGRRRRQTPSPGSAGLPGASA